MEGILPAGSFSIFKVWLTPCEANKSQALNRTSLHHEDYLYCDAGFGGVDQLAHGRLSLGFKPRLKSASAQ